jgi:hypothetical protein
MYVVSRTEKNTAVCNRHWQKQRRRRNFPNKVTKLTKKFVDMRRGWGGGWGRGGGIVSSAFSHTWGKVTDSELTCGGRSDSDETVDKRTSSKKVPSFLVPLLKLLFLLLI